MPLDFKELDAYSVANPSVRYDSLSAFAENELKAQIAQTYDRLYKELDAKTHIPIRSDIPAGLPAWSYDSWDSVGRADFLAAGGKNLSRADVSKKRFTFPVHTIASAYGWDLEEMEAARAVGVGLDSRRADAARRAIAEKEQSILLNGDVNYGLPGFLTNAAIPLISAPNGAWKTADGDDMVQDLQTMVDSVRTNSRNKHVANTVLLPLAQMRYMATKRLTDTNMSALEYFKAQNPEIREVLVLQELSTAGTSSVPRAMAYVKDPMVLGGVVPLAFQQMPPHQESAFEVLIACRSRQGGAVWTYPMAACFMDGI